MSSIGIIANPASGKDIRRLVSYATTIDNQEKINIVKRIVLAAQSLGVDRIWFMPDSFQIGRNVIEDLSLDGKLRADCRILGTQLTATSEDTVLAAAELERMGVGCVVVLGGDGTSRAAAKALDKVPLLPISTGTNNVYPTMVEGTVAGMAAATIARMENPTRCCIRDKRIEVWKNGSLVDIALVDAVISNDLWIGSKAIWDTKKLRRTFVTRCHPASIGFSAAVGCLRVLQDTDDYGFMLESNCNGKQILAPIAAGTVSAIDVGTPQKMELNEPVQLLLEENCMVALDGEREIRGKPRDTLSFVITRNGPWRIQIKQTLEEAIRLGFYMKETPGT